MRKWLKRIRGALGIGLTWAAAWSGVAVILALVGVFGTLGPILDYVVFAVLFGIVGFMGGAAFSVALGITERRRRFDEMSLRRFAFWGAVGGLLVSIPWVAGATLAEALSIGVVMTLTGAGSSAGSLALARRADDRELLEHGADVADIGLTEEEKRELLTE